MKKLLHIDSSVLGPHSVSRQVSAAIVERLRQATPDLDITYRDLTLTPLAHLSGANLAAAQGASIKDPAVQQELANSQTALAEVLAADILVLGAPMYNFTIPSQLKAWIDRILVAGKTFKYGAQGAEGSAGEQARDRGDLARRILRPGRPDRGSGTPRNLSTRRVRLYRRHTTRVHFGRRHPDRP